MNEKERDKSRNKSRISTIQTNTKVKDPLLNEIFFDKYKTIKKFNYYIHID